jgi:uncharacterized protein YjbI with pentapeptide repeats
MEMFMKTVPAEQPSDCQKPVIKEGDERAYWAMADSRGKLKGCLHVYRQSGYGKDVIVLVSESTPQDYLDYLKERNYDYIVAGSDHVNLRMALMELNRRYGFDTVATDTGGILAAALLEENLVDEVIFSFGTISDCSLENFEAERMTFKQVIFKKVTFNKVAFRRIELINVRFQNCDLSNVDFSEAILHRVEFLNCKIIGINLSEATLRDVTFEDCNGQYAFFSYSNCKQVAFLRCQLISSDFKNSLFSKVEFQESNLRQAQMNFTNLKGIDFTSCDIEGMGVNITDVNGVIVNAMQAVSLSALLGLIVK